MVRIQRLCCQPREQPKHFQPRIQNRIRNQTRPPFLILYTDIASAPPPSNNEEKEATDFFVNILLIVPLVYYILKEELKSTTERDENDTKLIKYIVKFGFQDYLPSIITNSHVKEAYNLQVSLLQEGTVHVAATIFITYMIVSAMSHDGGQKVLDQALRHLVDQEVDQDHESTITNLGEYVPYIFHRETQSFIIPSK